MSYVWSECILRVCGALPAMLGLYPTCVLRITRYVRIVSCVCVAHYPFPLVCSPSIFLGESASGSTYVLPSLVDDRIATIKRRLSNERQLEGPSSDHASSSNPPPNTDAPAAPIILPVPDSRKGCEDERRGRVEEDAVSDAELPKQGYRYSSLLSECLLDDGGEPVLVLGHYIVPVELHNVVYQIRPGVLPLGITHVEEATNATNTNNISGSATHRQEPVTGKQGDSLNYNGIYKQNHILTESFFFALIVLLIVLVLYCIYLLRSSLLSMREVAVVTSTSRSSQHSTGSCDGGEVTALLEELSDGSMRVGKITYMPRSKLGKGSDGTVVYKGTFEGRDAAVKRVLPNSYLIANREVELLRSSDQHHNVIRYLCTEQCREFRYIALELCDATLDWYVLGHLDQLPRTKETSMSVLQQAARGLGHLHSLNIVHRDIKPSNVLLQLPRHPQEDVSVPGPGLRVLISDFGLCKKLDPGHGSFTKHSGITGTDGWIAPEMLHLELEDLRPTRAVDVFSLGCVYYYVDTNGQHPFGSSIDRQSNISANDCNLEGAKNHCLKALLRAMLNEIPERRPPVRAVLRHPYFWDDNTVLNFLVDASDRVDKADADDQIRILIETNAKHITTGWLSEIDIAVRDNLRAHREYFENMCDLLRAVRNKRTHFQELPAEVQHLMGPPPHAFLHYWSCRFPSLLHHTWRQMHCCAKEHTFAKYYSSKHNFHTTPQVSYATPPRK